MKKISCPNVAKNLFILLIVSLVFARYFQSNAYALTSDNINFQGKIVRNDTGFEGLNVVPGFPACVVSGAGNDTCDFQVAYYTASSGGTLLLTELFSNVEIGQYDGVFELSLGSGSMTTTAQCKDGTCNTPVEVISEYKDLFLELKFSPDGTNLTETFTRMPLEASPYAILSKYAEGANDAFKLSTSVSSQSQASPVTGMVYYNTTTSQLTVYDGDSWEGVKSSLWTDAGSFTYLTSASDDLVLGATTVADSTFFFDMDGSSGSYLEIDDASNTNRLLTILSGGNVGIGTATPGAKLEVAGSSSTITNASGNLTISTGGLNGDILLSPHGTGRVLVSTKLGIKDTGATPTHYTFFQGGNQSADITYTLPTADGTASGQVLTTNASGVLSWQTVATGSTAWDDILDPDSNSVIVHGAYSTDMQFDTFTAGSAFKISSAATGLTGSLLDVSLSGSNAANTGSLFALNNTGTLNPNTSFLINHYATGTGNLAFRVNDVSGDTTPFVIDGNGNVGIGQSSPTAYIHIKAGTAAVNTAPLKFTTGVNLTTAESGAMEWDGNRLYMTDTTPTRNTLAYTSELYWTRNSSTLYPATSGDSVLPNGTANLGSDASRWADIFLSSSTLHLGSSITDEGIISYDTTNNIFKFDTDSTTNGDISFFTDDLYLDKSTGRVGIGTTTPSNKFVVNTSEYSTIELLYGGTPVVDIFSNTSSNIFIGLDSGTSISSGTGNVAYGYNALKNNTTGNNNTAIGRQALVDNITGYENVAIGEGALYTNVGKTRSVAIGHYAMRYADNTATIVASNNVAIGYYALMGSTIPADNTGRSNTAVGFFTLPRNTSGNDNTAIGTSTLGSNTTGSGNTMLGSNVGTSNTTGSQNTIIGYRAYASNVGKTSSTAFGYEAMRFADSTISNTPTYNTAIGYQALRGSITPANNTGIYNTAVGYQAGLEMSSGSNNLLLGYLAGSNITTGSNNIIIGNNISASSDSTNSLNIGNTIYGEISTDRVGIGISSPTAVLNLYAGTATAGTAPLKFTTGVNLTSPESGAMEWDGSRLYITDSTPTRNTLAYLTDIPSGATYWTRNGTDLYPTTSGDSVLPNGTVNLGSDTARWADLFLSSSTLHIGSSITDEGVISYNSSNIFQFDTDTTTNGDISFFTDDLYLDKSTSRVGIGTTGPTAKLEVVTSTSTTDKALYVHQFENSGTMYGVVSVADGVGATNNIGGYFSSTGATNNYGLLVANGNVGIGTTTPSNKFVVNTSGYSTIELQYGGTSVVDIFSNVSSNIFIGLDSGSVISTGTGNVALGDNALSANTTGLSNTAIGHFALDTNVAKQGSTALGYQAMMYADSTAVAGLSYNTAIGYQALTGSGVAANNTGTQNTAIGHQSMTANTSGSSNTAVGVNTLNANTTGTQNVAMGFNSLFTNVARQGSVAIGFEAMRYADSTATANQSFNTAIGFRAFRGSTNPANNTGTRNTALGYNVLLPTTSGSSNTGIGSEAGMFNSSGGYNTMIGDGALKYNSVTSGSTAIGYNAMLYANYGETAVTTFNTAVGYEALKSEVLGLNNTGVGNTAIGFRAGYTMTSGSNNTLLGYGAGDNITTGGSNIIIGQGVDAPSATDSYQLNIGNSIYGNLSNDYISIGDSTPTEAMFTVGATSQFRVDTSGDLIRIKNVPYVWPSSNGVGVLSNNGSGTLSWNDISASLLPTGTEGQMLYNNAGAWTAYSGMHWDDTNSRLGVGTTSPSRKLEVAGSSDTAIFALNPGTGAGSVYTEMATKAWGASYGMMWNAYRDTADPVSADLWVTGNTKFKDDNDGYSKGAYAIGGILNTPRFGIYFGGISTGADQEITWTQQAQFSDSSIWLSTEGTSSDFYLASSGNLGLGTTNPSARLDIAGASSTISNASGNITITPASNLIVSQGNVGVGTSSIISGVKLQVQEDYAGTNDLQVPLSIVRTTSGTAANGMGVGIDFRLEDSATNLIGAAQIFGLWENASSTSTAGALTFRTSGDGTALAERMRISSSGIVGIGTTSPISTANNKLDVFNSTTLTNMTVSTVDYATVNILSGTVSGTQGFGDFSVNAYYDGSTWTKRNTSYESWIMGIGTRTDSNGKIEFVHSDAGAGFTMVKPMIIKPASVLFGDYLEVFSGNAKTVSTPFIRASSTGNVVLNGYSTGGVYFNWDSTGTGGFFVGDGAGTNSANYVFNLAGSATNRGRIYSQASDATANSTDTNGGVEVGPYRVIQAVSSNTLYEYYSNASSVAYRIMTTGTAMDLAEWYPVGNIDLDINGNSELKKGEILCLDNNDATKVVRCDSTHTNVVGIVSTASYTTMGIKDMDDLREDDVEVALTGRVPAIVTSKNGPIAIGDFITYSNLRGVGQKATNKVQVVAKALDTFNPSSCSPASSLESISWPFDENGDNPTKPCYKLPDGTYVGKIMVFPNISVFNPNETYTTKQLINNGWYRIAQLNGTDGNAKFKIKNNSVGSYQNLLLNVDTVSDKNIVNIVSNFTSGGYDISKARINSVGGIKYLEIYLEEVNSNSIVVNIDGQQGDWISTSITEVIDIPSISNEFAFNGVLFGISDILQVEDTGLKVGGDLIASSTNSNIGDTISRWNDIYAKGAIRLGSGSGQEGAIRFNTESKRLELSNDGTTWVQLGDLTSQMVISPEYPGAILFADGSENLGKMTSDAIEENSTFKNYYEWISNKETAQDYDILVRITLPNDFVSWKDDAIYLDYMTENSVSVENNSVDVTLIGNSGVDAQSIDHISTLPGAWERMSLKSIDINDCNTAGASCTLRLSLTSSMEYFVRVGDITLNYNRSL